MCIHSIREICFGNFFDRFYGSLWKMAFNLCMPNGFSNPYNLGESISKFRIFEWYFSFLLKFNRTI